MSCPRILVVDDKRDLAQGVALAIEELSDEIRVAHSAEEALAQLDRTPAELVFTDVRMPGMDGIALLKRIKERWPETDVIVFTAYGSIESAVEAMRLGAFHYLTKPFNSDELLLFSRRALEQRRAGDELRRLRAEVEGRFAFHGIWGRDPAMLALFDTVRRVAPAGAAIMVCGESGTGKELIARAIHAESPRASGPFVAFNAAALPDTLAEAELFGARKGAYTGADRDRAGLFSEADGGTLFIDELASMSAALQGKLLRALQEGEVLPLGAGRPVAVDVRIVSAVNTDPMVLLQDGRLRRDLYYRLAVIKLTLPPLRDRVEDIPLLAHHFLQQHTARGAQPAKTLTPEAVRLLVSYRWPGNVRELHNVIERAALLTPGDTIGPGQILLEEEPSPARRPDGRLRSYEEGKAEVLADFQRRYAEQILSENNGNIAAAARQAGITRAAFYRIMQRVGLSPTGESPGSE